MACLQRNPDLSVEFIQPHDLAEHLHSDNSYVLLDCRPVLAYNSCHISGAVNVNFTGMMRKRFIAGKIGLADLVTTEEGRQRFKDLSSNQTVVYDEDTSNVDNLTTSNSVYLVVSCLMAMGQMPYLLAGGLNQFGSLHPSLCEISAPLCRSNSTLPPPVRASTPGMRDQALDWQTAPPVHVLSFLVLGSERDAKSKEIFDWFNIGYVLNVTPGCPNQFEDKGVIYKRIAVSDTGTQKLSNQFQDAFDFIESARNNNSVILIHCMAGISRSVTLTIAYIMAYFNMTMQDAYQYVKDKRPAISPNLNFMGQLVEFERYCQENGSKGNRDLNSFLPSKGQQDVSKKLMEKLARSGSTSSLSGKSHVMFETSRSIDKGDQQQQNDSGLCSPNMQATTTSTSVGGKPFVLKPLNPKTRRSKKTKDLNNLDNSTNNSSIVNESTDSKPSAITETKEEDTVTSTSTTTTSCTSNNEQTATDSTSLSNDQSSTRPKSPRQMNVLSIKGEKMNLQQHKSPSRSDRSISPSPSPPLEGNRQSS